jgi:hypothetical protein
MSNFNLSSKINVVVRDLKKKMTLCPVFMMILAARFS